MYLFFDTETSGLPRNWKAPVTDTRNWPRLVQIGWITCKRDGTVTDEKEYIIKPEGFIIPKAATKTHGITTERALAEGADLMPILDEFTEAVNSSLVLVAHNISFDEKILGAEFVRAKKPDPMVSKVHCCTMKRSTNHCKIPGPYGYKWPSMEELHIKLFGESFENAHGALPDCSACKRCFFRLKELGVL